MNYGELKTQVLDYMHRPDLVDEVPGFIEAARQRINQRFDQAYPAFVSDSDTNDFLTDHSQIWLYAALVDGYAFLVDGDNMKSFDILYMDLAKTLNIQRPENPADNYGLTDGGPPQIKEIPNGA